MDLERQLTARLEALLATMRAEAISGDDLDELFRLAMPDLKRIAAALMHLRHGNGPAQPSSLVNQSALRVLALAKQNWNNYAHFLRYAARTMRSVLSDQFRRQSAAKRSAPQTPLELGELQEGADLGANLVEIDDLLHELARIDPALVTILEMRIFLETPKHEIAHSLGVSMYELERRLTFGLSWMKSRLAPNP